MAKPKIIKRMKQTGTSDKASDKKRSALPVKEFPRTEMCITKQEKIVLIRDFEEYRIIKK